MFAGDEGVEGRTEESPNIYTPGLGTFVRVCGTQGTAEALAEGSVGRT